MIKNLIPAFIFIHIYSLAFAQQTNTDTNKEALEKFTTFFNSQQIDSIYQQWSDQAKEYVSKNQLDTLLQEQLYPLGTIQSSKLLQAEEGLSYYELDFPKDTLKLALSTDSNDKIETFYLQPYTTIKNDTIAIDSLEVDTSIHDTVQKETPESILENGLDNFIDSLALKYTNRPNTSGLAIGILREGKTNYYYYGETTHGNNHLPGNETLFEISSITKTITATLLAHQALSKKISLKDAISKYLPDSVTENQHIKSITFRNLATHTAGLPRLPENLSPTDSLDPYKDYTREQLFSYLKYYIPHHKPDSLYEYSNLGYGLIGELLASINNSSYHELVQEHISKPLALQQLSEFPDNEQLANFIPTYNKAGQLTPHWHFLAMSAAGSLKASLPDLIKFTEAQINPPKNLLGEAIRLTQQPAWLVSETQDSGLAWHITIEDFQEIFWHNGATFGSSSYLAFIPKKKVAVVVLANAAESVDAMGYAIIKKLLASGNQ